MYNNLHNKDLDTIIDLNSAKEIWERLEFMHEGEISNNSAKDAKRKSRKKKACQKENVQLNETYYASHSCEGTLAKEQTKLDSALDEKVRLSNESRDRKKLLQICDEREHEYKEETISLKT